MAEKYTKKELDDIKKGTRDVVDMAKKFGYEMSVVDGLTESVKANMGKIADATTKAGTAAKKEKKFREDSNDLTKEILENVQNIGTEEFKSLDVTAKLAINNKNNNRNKSWV